MTIRLDHTIVAARDKDAAARYFADIFGLSVKPGNGYFRQVQINDSLTFDFADAGNDAGEVESQHYAFHVADEEFDAIFARIEARGVPYGSGPFSLDDGKFNRRRGGRGFYFLDPDGHVLEVMTVRETGSDTGA